MLTLIGMVLVGLLGLAVLFATFAQLQGPPDEEEDEEDDDGTDLYVPVPTSEDEADGQ